MRSAKPHLDEFFIPRTSNECVCVDGSNPWSSLDGCSVSVVHVVMVSTILWFSVVCRDPAVE